MPICKFCPMDLVWRKTKNDKPMPLEVGKVSIMDKHGQVHSGELVHWGRCPGSDQVRKPKENSPIFGMGKGRTL